MLDQRSVLWQIVPTTTTIGKQNLQNKICRTKQLKKNNTTSQNKKGKITRNIWSRYAPTHQRIGKHYFPFKPRLESRQTICALIWKIKHITTSYETNHASQNGNCECRESGRDAIKRQQCWPLLLFLALVSNKHEAWINYQQSNKKDQNAAENRVCGRFTQE